MILKILLAVFMGFASYSANAQQQALIQGTINQNAIGVPYAEITLNTNNISTVTDTLGVYRMTVPYGNHVIKVTAPGFKAEQLDVVINEPQVTLNFSLEASHDVLHEVVVTGTQKAVRRIESAVPVEVYTPVFFKKNPTPNIFEALQNVNGVRPQINCNVCNTGDIHINGLEGPYTMVLIDGMPIVSGLSTVYGLSGIPTSLLERIEIVKGPASSLYGSEAVGGLINIITKNPNNAPVFSADVFSTSWGEANLDAGFKLPLGPAAVLTGINYYNYSHPIDQNKDNFTDVTLQDRISVFQKWTFDRRSNRLFAIAGRYFYEDRWGGEMQWQPKYRGGNEVYGESIYTKRWELFGAYELPVKEKMNFGFSYTHHDQNSVYGTTHYLAEQKIGFAQLTWNKELASHDFLAGISARYQLYDDNTTATPKADETCIPGIFIQDEFAIAPKHNLLLGVRYDYNNRHGSIFTPRFAYKWKLSPDEIIRLNSGTGFRVVNLFTEEHAALTGSRDVVIAERLKPEKSYNVNLNYLKKFYWGTQNFGEIEATAWYTHFSNSILPDYDTDPNKIIYKNLDGYAVTKGVSINADVSLPNGLKFVAGATLMNVSKTTDNVKSRQLLTERFSATWSVSYRWRRAFLDIDYTGNAFGRMRLPLLGPLDPRKEYSPLWSIQNIQLTFRKFRNLEIYFGIKNLLDWTPNRGNPFIIARADDPFDQNVEFDPDGNAVATPDNPYALTFDPGYVYAPNQGLRTFGGIRFTLK